MEAIAVTLLIAFPVAGAILRRWTALTLPLVGWPLFYLGLDQGWWGYGLGDGWQDSAVALTLVGVVTTALLVGLARRFKPRRSDGLAHVA